jgi:hypothetical protein
MTRPKTLDDRINVTISLERKQLELLEGKCGYGKISSYIRELVESDGGKLQPFMDLISSQQKTIENLHSKIEELRSKEAEKAATQTAKEIGNTIETIPESHRPTKMIRCPHCGNENVVINQKGSRKCWFCERVMYYDLANKDEEWKGPAP